MPAQTIEYPGLIGASYTNISVSVEGERCINFYPEMVESGHGKGNVVLLGTPGLKKLVSAARAAGGLDTLPDRPVRGSWAGNNRLFVVAGATVFEVFDDWTYGILGTVARDTNPVQMFFNGTQIFIVAAQQGYITTNTEIPTPGSVMDAVKPVVAAATGEYMDTFFVAEIPDTTKFQLSASMDGSSWNGLDFASKEADAFQMVSMLTDHELLILFGTRSIEFWENAGNPNFAFQRVSGGVIEQGCGARFSPARIGTNTIAWLGYDMRGEGMVWKAQGFTPVRISNHCVEEALRSYRAAGADLSRAVGIAKQHGGHHWYELHIPGANQGRGATWVYDDTASQQMQSAQWHEKLSWRNGQWWGEIHRTHAYVFGMHIVGDAASGNLYEESLDYFDAAGTPIRRQRSSPHVHEKGQMIFYGGLWLDAMVGQPSALLDGLGRTRAPQIAREISNDGGYTWGPERWRGMGMTGQYKARARWTRGGCARDRCDRFTVTDPIRWALIGAWMDVEPGTA